LTARLCLGWLAKKGFKDDLRGDRVDFHMAFTFLAAFIMRVVAVACRFARGEAFVGGVDGQVVTSGKAIGEAFCLECHLVFAAIHIEWNADDERIGLPGLH